jgi:hypothetical protein
MENGRWKKGRGNGRKRGYPQIAQMDADLRKRILSTNGHE